MSSSPIASGGPRFVELQRTTSFKDEPDQGRDLELSMVVGVFKRLQDAGYLDAKATLADRLEKNGFKSTSIEARLRELIKDVDGNGLFDLDLKALADSKMLKGAPTEEQLEAAISGRTVGGFSDDFYRTQKDTSRLWSKGQRSEKAEAVQSYASELVLSNNQDRSTKAFLDEATARAAKSPDEAKGVMNEAINGALVLTGKGNAKGARELLEGAGLALSRAGRLDEATKCFQELTRAPHASVARNTLQDVVDQAKVKEGAFDEASGYAKGVSANGNVLRMKPGTFASTVGQVAQVRIDQLVVEKRMAAALGRTVDPRNADDARAYFQTFAKTHSTAEVASEYQSYLKAFFKHSGLGVEWTASIPPDQRGGRINELLDAQPADDAGRGIIDCEGFSYLTEHILGGLEDEKGKRRFEVLYATRPAQLGHEGHVITGVVDKQSKQAFTVSNSEVGTPQPATSPTQVNQLIAKTLGIKDRPTFISVGSKQSESEPLTDLPGKAPKVGALVWSGTELLDITMNKAVQDLIVAKAEQNRPVNLETVAKEMTDYARSRK